MTFYIGVVDHGGEGYGMWFPDLPGCTSGGRTIDELFGMGIEAVSLWVECRLTHGQPVPQARGLAELRGDPDVQEALRQDVDVTFLQIPLFLEEKRSTTANISLDIGALRAIDAAAAQRGMTRSAFMTGAALEKLGMKVATGSGKSGAAHPDGRKSGARARA